MSDDIRLRLSLPRPGFQLAVDLTLPGQGIAVLFGHSGSGKTSLLRCVAGLEPDARGLVRIGSACWQDDATGIRLPTWQRSLGYVFQEASLFPHLDVRGNLGYGLRRVGQRANRAALDDAIGLLGIGHLLDRRADQLSGGERQRVAIARALAPRPRLLLLDEPLAAIDQARRQEVLPWLARMRDELSIPMLYVTHAIDEAARLGDHLVVLDAGQLRTAGPVAEVLSAIEHPLMVGDEAGALVHARLVERDARWHLVRAEFPGGSVWVRDDGQAVGAPLRLRVLARDISVQLQQPSQTSIQNHLLVMIESISDEPQPSQALLRLRCDRTVLLARLTRRSVAALDLHPGKAVWAQIKAVAVIG